MAVVAIKCPNCCASLDLDDSKESGFCMYCGSQVQIKEEKTRIELSGSVKFDESGKYANYLNLATNAYTAGNMAEAYTYYTKALEIKQTDYLPVFRKSMCAGYLSGEMGYRNEEVIMGVSRAFDLSSDFTVMKNMSKEIVVFAISPTRR